MRLRQHQISNLLIFLFLLVSTLGFSQSAKKKLLTQSTTEKIIVDGKFDEACWQKADIAKDFVMWMPDNGTPEPQNQKTEVKIVYDNNAIYIAATMYDNEPNKILRELSQRDDSGTVDRFGVFINGFNDGQQEFSFIISAAGV
ncbi:MAG: carbohydrate binding family 9 domain-containing protein, partial [Flavobacterium sp.]|nr:carbohydrate binding family 9 domain-containing protein [Flavobacterium sp.]